MLDQATGHGAPMAQVHDHLVAFYDDADELAASVVEFFLPALSGTGAAVLVATPEHAGQLAHALGAAGLDTHALEADGRLVVLDAAETLAAFTAAGEQPDPDRFRTVIGGLLGLLTAGGREVRVFGEMVALLWSRGDVDGAVALEAMWNDLAAEHDFALLCAYPMGALNRTTASEPFLAVCREHSAVIPNQAFRAGASWSDQLIALLRATPDSPPAVEELERVRGDFVSMVVDNLRSGLLRRGDDLIAEARRTMAEIDLTLPGAAAADA